MDKEYIEREPLQKLFNEVSTSLLCKKELVKDTEHLLNSYFFKGLQKYENTPANLRGGKRKTVYDPQKKQRNKMAKASRRKNRK